MKPLRLLVLALALALPMSGYAGSGAHNSDPKPKQHTDYKIFNSKQAPLFVQQVLTPDVIAQASQKGAEEEKKLHYDEFLTWATVALAFCTLGLWIATVCLARDAKRTSEEQGRKMERSLAIAKISADASNNNAQAVIAAERAYVQLSHLSGENNPGLNVNRASGESKMVISVKNHGNTPAKVTRIFITKRVLDVPLPALPQYEIDLGELKDQPVEAFLMKEADVTVSVTFNIDPKDIPLIINKRKQLVVYGYVDYTDQFGRDFRGGYARNWVPGLVPNNLVFVTQSNYNYDHER